MKTKNTDYMGSKKEITTTTITKDAVMDLSDNESYIQSCIKIAEKKLKQFQTIEEIEKNIEAINEYQNISFLSTPKDVFVLDQISEKELERAEHSVLDGRFFAEHAAAGEATRLGLGTKYMINIAEGLSTKEIAKLISEEKGKFVSEEDVLKEAGCAPSDILPISIGTRHMIQYSFDICKLAKKHGKNPEEVLAKQKMLIILNETYTEQIITEFIKCRFFGFKRENVYFMVQKSYHGIKKEGQQIIYDLKAPKRLHNHGQMVMQETMDDEIFSIDEKGNRKYLKAKEFGEMLGKMYDKLSYNIEDLGFLIDAIDYKSLAVALLMSDKGYRMVMEIVANNPDAPQKGGMAAFDKKLGRNVMIEAFQLRGIKNADIKFLNKNFNHYPKPYDSWKLLKEKGLNMPITIKHNAIYFQAIQGDINFLVKTQFVQRKVLKPIQSWKSPATTPLTMRYMKLQDEQEGFIDYAKKFVKGLKD
jgi:hypothetical protein